jgi:hypothetical protein
MAVVPIEQQRGTIGAAFSRFGSSSDFGDS